MVFLFQFALSLIQSEIVLNQAEKLVSFSKDIHNTFCLFAFTFQIFPIQRENRLLHSTLVWIFARFDNWILDVVEIHEACSDGVLSFFSSDELAAFQHW